MNVNDDPQYQLFFNYHYTVKVEQSLRPIFSSRGMSFPVSYSYYRRKLSIIDKIRYYWMDLMLWLKMKDTR